MHKTIKNALCGLGAIGVGTVFAAIVCAAIGYPLDWAGIIGGGILAAIGGAADVLM